MKCIKRHSLYCTILFYMDEKDIKWNKCLPRVEITKERVLLAAVTASIVITERLAERVIYL